jgi:hypothetical protein
MLMCRFSAAIVTLLAALAEPRISTNHTIKIELEVAHRHVRAVPMFALE